jgi:uncharacterized protein YabE (DUF348 family)
MKDRRVSWSVREAIAGALGALRVLFPSAKFLAAIALGAFLLALGLAYWLTQRTVVLQINGVAIRHRTHERTVAGVLYELGITLRSEDILLPPTEQELAQGVPIHLQIARPVILLHDGSVSQVRTHAQDIAGALRDMDAVIFAHDLVLLGHLPCDLNAPLPAPTAPTHPRVVQWIEELARPVRLSVRRAVPLQVQDGALSLMLYTTARTVGEALHDHGMLVYLGDRVFPDTGSRVSPGLTVFIERSKPLVLDLGGEARALRTRLDSVGELLGAEGVTLGPKDYVRPELTDSIVRNARISVVRVLDQYHFQETPIAFKVFWEPDPTTEIDQTWVRQAGKDGATRERIRVRYENGIEVDRTVEEEWLAYEPLHRIIHYGTKIVWRVLQTPDGPLEYWRKIRMLATSYNAPTAGKPREHPAWGITRMGLRARKGIVAIDPNVVNLGQMVYVPNYGSAIAADTGSAIIGRRIDLCYDDDNLVLWYSWVDVYLVAPVPAENLIRWILPG